MKEEDAVDYVEKIALLIIRSLLFMCSWNWIIVSIFNLRSIGFLESLCFLILISVSLPPSLKKD